MNLKTLLKVGRVSNVPTVWSNILAAFFISHYFNGNEIIWSTLFILIFILSLIYVGGMYLNDAFDASWDKENQNFRPIVEGEIKELYVWIIGLFLMLISIIISIIYLNTLASIATIFLIISIFLYNALHKKHPSSSFFMGISRGFIYLITALSIGDFSFEILIFMIGMIFYITGVTYLAKGEHKGEFLNRYAIGFLFFPVLSLLLVVSDFKSLIGSLFFIFWILWICFKYLMSDTKNIRGAIGALLGAISLIDALYLFSIDSFIPAIISLGIFFMIPYLHKYISGT